MGVVFGRDAPPSNANTTDHDYPNGYPCIVVQDYENKRNQPSMLVVKRGDKGKVRAVDAHQRLAGVILTDATMARSRTGYVPLECITIGNRRKAGDLWALITIPSLSIGNTLSPPSLHTASVFGRTLGLLFTRIYENREGLDLPPALASALDTSAKVQGFTEAILKGTQKAGLLHVFETPNFSVWDLKKHGHVLSKGSPNNKGGIYAIIYWDFEDDPMKVIIYIGQTWNFTERWLEGHIPSLDSARRDPSQKTLKHYKLAAKANSRVAVPICYLDGSALRTGAEQAFVSMLKTYSQAAKAFSNVEICNIDEVEEEKLNPDGGKQEKATDIAQQSADLGSSDWRQELTRNARLVDLADAVFRESGWSDGTDNHAFGATLGANFKSPLYESQRTRVPLVKTARGNTVEYRRCKAGAVKSFANGYQIKMDYWRSSSDSSSSSSFHIHKYLLASDPRAPAVGTYFDVVFSRALKGIHPDRYLLVQEVGPRSDHNLALSLSIRFEWDGKDSNRYAMIARDATLVHRGSEYGKGEYREVARVAGIVRWLMQQKSTKDTKYRYGAALLYEVRFLHLDQCFAVTENAGATEEEATPSMSSLDEIEQDIVVRGASTLRRAKVPTCDRCLMMVSIG